MMSTRGDTVTIGHGQRECRRRAHCVRRATIHDLRHTFAVRTLIEWLRAGIDVGAGIPALSTYLGHVNPAGTYWYLQASPELMELAAIRLDGRFGGGQ